MVARFRVRPDVLHRCGTVAAYQTAFSVVQTVVELVVSRRLTDADNGAIPWLTRNLWLACESYPRSASKWLGFSQPNLWLAFRTSVGSSGESFRLAGSIVWTSGTP